MLRLGRYAFAPRVLPTIAAAAFIALTVGLGRWQAHRAEEKLARQAAYEARTSEPAVRLTGAVESAQALLFRRVRVDGTWMPAHQVFIDNRVHAGRAGFEVVTPLRLEGSREAVLVDRGWIARDSAYPMPPRAPAPAGKVEVTGLATVPSARFIELSPQVITGSVFQNLTIERYRAWSGLAILPIVIVADVPGAGLVAVREKPDAGAATNRQYEFTWFLLAATAAVMWTALNLRRTA